MKRAVSILAVLTIVGGIGFAQDEGERKTEALDEPADIIRESLLKAIEKGGVVVKGSLERKNPFGGMGVKVAGLGGGEIEGDFTATIGKNGVSLFTVENENGRLEVYRKGDRTVQRQTWAGGKQPAVGEFAKEISRLLSLKTVKSYIRNAKGLKEVGSKTVNGKECRVIKGSFPAGLLEDDEEENEQDPMQFKFKLFEVKGVRAKFYIDKESGELQKFEMSVTKGYSAAIRMGGMGGAGEEEEDEEEGEGEGDEEEEEGGPGQPFELGKMKFVSSYSFTIQKYDSDLTVTIPKDLAKFFEE